MVDLLAEVLIKGEIDDEIIGRSVDEDGPPIVRALDKYNADVDRASVNELMVVPNSVLVELVEEVLGKVLGRVLGRVLERVLSGDNGVEEKEKLGTADEKDGGLYEPDV